MKRSEVEEKLAEFMALIDRQQTIREELLRLKMWGTRATEDDVNQKIEQHQELITEIECLREERMLPILEELARFVCGAQAPAPRSPGSWQNVRSILKSGD